MNTSLYISSGALQAFQQKLDTTANNIANVNTTGFKQRDLSFSELLASQVNNQTVKDREVGRLTPNGLRVGYGTRTGLTQLNMEQGQPLQTGNPFDLMIQGNGFFQIGYPSTNEVRYTRDGNFHLSVDSNKPGNYHLVNANGGYLLDQNGTPIELNDQEDVNIDSSGQIQLKNKNGQGTTFLSSQRVGLVDIQNPHVLQNVGNNEFAIDPAQLSNGATAASFVRVMPSGEANIISGSLEGSNVDLTKEMTNLMTSQRSFQLNARAVTYADQMNGIANSIVK
ncbi:flagellar hook-basal body protein [Neobacillus massiliamazoniensis]|uniref:Flagellar hook-basal body protein n=1 Tax=Neobacillus massiliamazoniensis TaxID=1499688 RepID=A0A0U1NSA1_9BACI|nr:flagellar hook-basal body protein [Neobacillus massiliamazoniensis]CRK80929.1 flagellar hook-basal body protein [Neobacillus massiliamazoniensis]